MIDQLRTYVSDRSQRNAKLPTTVSGRSAEDGFTMYHGRTATSNGKPTASGSETDTARPTGGATPQETMPSGIRELHLAGMSLAELEKLAINQTLEAFDGNRTKAARSLGISVRTLQRKLRMWRNAKRSAASQNRED